MRRTLDTHICSYVLRRRPFSMVERFAGFDVRPWPAEATRHYARIRTSLERVGQTIGGMDLLIAAHAMAENSVLVTNNAHEFLRVPGLAVEEWDLNP